MSSPESRRSVVPRADETDLLSALIRGTARGDRDSFAELYHQSARKVYGLALSIALNQQLSQKITEEVFQTVWARANAFDPDLSPPMTWLMTLTHRAAVSTVRSQRSSLTPPTAAHAPTRLSIDGDGDAEPSVRTSTSCLEHLTVLQRETLNLTFLGCATYTQAADHLGVPVHVIRTNIQSGLQQLKVNL